MCTSCFANVEAASSSGFPDQHACPTMQLRLLVLLFPCNVLT